MRTSIRPTYGNPDGAVALTVPARYSRQYQPQTGDVWVLTVFHPHDVDAVAPAGWTLVGSEPDLYEGHPVTRTVWYRLLVDPAPAAAVVVHLQAACQAAAFMVMCRPDVSAEEAP